LDGYARDPESMFIVLKSGVGHLKEYMQSLDHETKFRRRLRLLLNMMNVNQFLKENGLVWKHDGRSLSVNDIGELLLGARDDISHATASDKRGDEIVGDGVVVYRSRPDPLTGKTTYGAFPTMSPTVMTDDAQVCSISAAEKEVLVALHLALEYPQSSRATFVQIADLYSTYFKMSTMEFDRTLGSWEAVHPRPAAVGSMGYLRMRDGLRKEFVLLEESKDPPIVGWDEVTKNLDVYTKKEDRESTSVGPFELFENEHEIRAYICFELDTEAKIRNFNGLFRSGLAIAHLNKFPLRDLVIVNAVCFQLNGSIHPGHGRKPVSCSYPKYLHLRPYEADGFPPLPWGYFADSREPVASGDALPFQSVHQQDADCLHGRYWELFTSTLPEFSGNIEQQWIIHFISLGAIEQAMTEWMRKSL